MENVSGAAGYLVGQGKLKASDNALLATEPDGGNEMPEKPKYHAAAVKAVQQWSWITAEDEAEMLRGVTDAYEPLVGEARYAIGLLRSMRLDRAALALEHTLHRVVGKEAQDATHR